MAQRPSPIASKVSAAPPVRAKRERDDSDPVRAAMRRRLSGVALAVDPVVEQDPARAVARRRAAPQPQPPTPPAAAPRGRKRQLQQSPFDRAPPPVKRRRSMVAAAAEDGDDEEDSDAGEGYETEFYGGAVASGEVGGSDEDDDDDDDGCVLCLDKFTIALPRHGNYNMHKKCWLAKRSATNRLKRNPKVVH